MPPRAPSDPLPRSLVAVTAVTAIVDAVAFLGLGQIFTAFMTGNLLFLGFAAAGGEGLEPLGSGTAVAAFAAGAVVGSRLGAAMAADRYRLWLFTSASTAACLLVAAAVTALGLGLVEQRDPVPRHLVVIALTAMAMGLRSATMWRLGAVLNTTLVTGTLVTLIRTSPVGGGGGGELQRYRAAGLLAVVVGAAIGTLLLRLGLSVALLVAAAGVLGGMGAYVASPASRRRSGA
ncbi:YoaK family protein [Streptomyces sp. enrichment culture]|uniref:YoaK family protein n=1 Tax=Streptomyces sp. enrichment culture TaxID=1795815 RepID=UPI003F555234